MSIGLPLYQFWHLYIPPERRSNRLQYRTRATYPGFSYLLYPSLNLSSFFPKYISFLSDNKFDVWLGQFFLFIFIWLQEIFGIGVSNVFLFLKEGREQHVIVFFLLLLFIICITSFRLNEGWDSEDHYFMYNRWNIHLRETSWLLLSLLVERGKFLIFVFWEKEGRRFLFSEICINLCMKKRDTQSWSSKSGSEGIWIIRDLGFYDFL